MLSMINFSTFTSSRPLTSHFSAHSVSDSLLTHFDTFTYDELWNQPRGSSNKETGNETYWKLTKTPSNSSFHFQMKVAIVTFVPDLAGVVCHLRCPNEINHNAHEKGRLQKKASISGLLLKVSEVLRDSGFIV